MADCTLQISSMFMRSSTLMHELSLPFGHDFRRGETEGCLEEVGHTEWVTNCICLSVLIVPVFLLQETESLLTITRTIKACNVDL